MMGNAETFSWVREHAKEVDPKLWRTETAEAEADDTNGQIPDPSPATEPAGPPPDPRAFLARMRRETKLYDCHPELGIVTP